MVFPGDRSILKEKNPDSPIYLAIRSHNAVAIRQSLRGFHEVDGTIEVNLTGAQYRSLATAYTQRSSIDFYNAWQMDSNDHAATGYAKLCKVSIDDPTAIFRMQPQYFDSIDEIDIDEQCIAVHAGRTDWQGRNWVESRWSELCDLLHHRGWRVVRVGGGHEHPIDNCDIDLVGKLDLGQTAAAISKCGCLFGTDSSLMHIRMRRSQTKNGQEVVVHRIACRSIRLSILLVCWEATVSSANSVQTQ